MSSPSERPAALGARTAVTGFASAQRAASAGSRTIRAGSSANGVENVSKRAVPKFIQLKVELRQIEPLVWRRLVLPSRSSLSVLHRAIQAAMGWTESHLHQFDFRGLSYGPEYAWDPDFGEPLLSQEKQLRTLFDRPGEWLRYEYDFGDSWVHLIDFEHWAPPPKDDSRLPLCVDGARCCPPEDCGGVHGYERLLSILADPEDEEHEAMHEWVGKDFDPERFSLTETNARIRNWFS